MKIIVHNKVNNKENHNLVEKDEQFLQIQNLIDDKRNMLLNKQKQFRFITKQNRFLDAVKNDYSKYYNYIADQKQEQIKALELLNGYINDLTVSGELSKHNIDDAKMEQNNILKEVKTIKEGLDSIIDDTNYIGTKVTQKRLV
jgi:hypothetical protein